MNRDCEQPDDVRVVKTEQYCSSERCGSSPYRRERKPLVSIDLTAGAHTSAATNGHRFHSATLRPGVADFLLLADPFQLCQCLQHRRIVVHDCDQGHRLGHCLSWACLSSSSIGPKANDAPGLIALNSTK